MTGAIIFFLALSVFGKAVSLECYECSGSTNLEGCMSTVTCREEQVCYKNRTYSGKVVYDLGCIDKQTCGKYADRTNATAVMKITSSSLTQHCHECCSTDKCNRKLCVYKHPSLCIDDEAYDCALLNSVFHICTTINRAKKYCPKFCDLCDVVDGNWSPWLSWSQCDVTCENGTLTRTRSCSDPAPHNGGLNCEGNATEVKPCFRELCPVHGGWTDWVEWASCSVTCGFGLQRRSRNCTSPFPIRFGDHCFGDSLEYRQCFPGPCANGGWSDWQSWSNCNKECNSGFKTRLRTCSNPKPSPLGRDCPGSPVEISECEKICHGGWSDWQSWSNCNNECGTGFKTRWRTCSNPKPSPLGSDCPGSPIEISECEKICPSDCYDIKQSQSNSESGIYTLQLWKSTRKIRVFCDMDTDHGGWTVFQYRFNGSVDFYRNFTEYEQGFGNLITEFWLGLSYIQEIAIQGKTDLRIDLEAANGTRAYEQFEQFYLSEGPDYTLHLGSTTAMSGISNKLRFSYHNGAKFSTYDHDVDLQRGGNCAVSLHGAWWNKYCAEANLNGQYMRPGTKDLRSMHYESFMGYHALKSSKMMIRRN